MFLCVFARCMLCLPEWRLRALVDGSADLSGDGWKDEPPAAVDGGDEEDLVL